MNPVYESASRAPARRPRRAQRSRPFSLRRRRRLRGGAARRPSPRASRRTVVDARDAFRRHDRVRLAALQRAGRRRAQPARAVGRLLGADEPHRRGPAAGVRRLRPALAAAPTSKTGCATTGCSSSCGAATAPNFAAEYPRFRMNDDREVTCFALASDQLAGQGRARGRHSPPGWRRRTPTTAAPSSPRRWSKPSSSRRPTSGRRCARASRPAGRARRARRRACVSDVAAAAIGEIVDSPARYLAKKAGTATPRRRRADDAGAGSPRRDRQRIGRRAARRPLGARPARRPRRRTPGPASPARRRSSCSPTPPTSSCAPPAPLGKSGREIELSDDTLAWKVRAALRADNGRAPLAAGGAGDQRDVAGGAEGRRLGLLEGARPAGAGARFAGRRVAAREQPRAARRRSPAS